MIQNTPSLDLVEFIETKILPQYAAFDAAHNMEHVTRVIRHSLELVKTMVVSQRKIVAYEINDYFGMRDGKAYAKKLNEMFNNGVQAVQIVASLYYYAVDLMNFSALLAKGMTPKDAAAELGKHDFIFNVKGKAPECARRWGKPLLCRVIRRLADLDFEIKSGKCSTRISQELALAALVVR